MSHTVKFNSPFAAMRYASRYNRDGVQRILREAHVQYAKGEPFHPQQLHLAFAFAGIQGYPVDCFIKALEVHYKPKSIATVLNSHTGKAALASLQTTKPDASI